ncbi:hypothetical protein BGZ74_007376 [Mortierella antarctica]|nr:hypothetical protein BGZ74_007376 [Mortierella antarctica]
MSFPTDSKRTAPSAPPSIAVEEQATFGRQAPFASSVSGLAPSGLAPSGPQGSTEHSNNHLNQSLNPQEYPDTLHQAPPPTYDEVTRAPGAPQLPHGDHSNSSNSNYGDQPESSEHYSPSAPLLAPGTQGSNGYSSIPGPPVRSYASSVSSYASSSDPGRERRFNKFWIIFFAVVLILLVFDNDQQGRVCQEDSLMHRNLVTYTCVNSLVDFTITVSGVEGFITVEQDTKAEFTQFFAEAYASDRDRLRSIRTGVTQSEKAGKFYASTIATANYQDSGCVFANIRIVFGGQLKQVRRLKIASMEGNVTINMLDEGQAEILELDSRVITGHSSIRVKVPGEATIGGSVGSIRGDLELGNTFAVNMVEGNVAVNLAKSPSSRAMQGKVVVAQGNVTVGLVPHYNGVYTVETGDGDADLQNIDAERTVT